jgi:hypothetical protein
MTDLSLLLECRHDYGGWDMPTWSWYIQALLSYNLDEIMNETVGIQVDNVDLCRTSLETRFTST